MTIENLYNSFTVGFISAWNTKSYGTCFVASLRDDLYLVTDCHVLYCRRTEGLYDDSFSIRFTQQDSGPDDGIFLTLNNIVKEDVMFDVKLDIALVKLSGLEQNKLQIVNGEMANLSPLFIELFDSSIRWGKEVFVVGFPHSVMLDPPFDSKPTISKGVVSSIDTSNGHFIVDIPSIYGLSGSPVLAVVDNNLLLIGIVQKLFPFNAEWYSKNELGISRSDWHNSGYTKCLSATKIKAFIENYEGAE